MQCFFIGDWMMVANAANETLPLAHFGIRPFKGGGRPSHVWTSLESYNPERIDELHTESYRAVMVGCLVMLGYVLSKMRSLFLSTSKASRNQS